MRKNVRMLGLKKCIAIMLSGSLLLSCAHASGDRTKESQQKQETLESTGESLEKGLLTDWSAYLFVSEKYYGDMLWAISYMEDFAKDPNWERLEKARMALETADKYIREREMDAQELTTEEYEILEKAKEDLLFVQAEYATIAQTQYDLLLDANVFREDLLSGIFLRQDLSIFQEELRIERALYEDSLKILALDTEYLTKQLEDEDLVSRFQTFLEENCPLIAAYQSEIGTEDLEVQSDEVLDDMEILTSDLAKVIGRKKASLLWLEEQLESESTEQLKENAVSISALPLLLPLMNWDGAFSCTCYWKDAEGKVSVPKEGEAIDRVTDRCVYEYETVSETEYTDYIAMLDGLGFEPVQRQGEDGTDEKESKTFETIYKIADTLLDFSWEDGKAKASILEGAACFAPLWYISIEGAHNQ